MTEAEWLACVSFGPLWGIVERYGSVRKKLLFLASVVHASGLIGDLEFERSLRCAERGESYASDSPIQDCEFSLFACDSLPGGADESTACRILRDIFGNPFRPIPFDSSWLTSNVTVLAPGDLRRTRLRPNADSG